MIAFFLSLSVCLSLSPKRSFMHNKLCLSKAPEFLGNNYCAKIYKQTCGRNVIQHRLARNYF